MSGGSRAASEDDWLAAELDRLAQLHRNGSITDGEFEAAKLAAHQPPPPPPRSASRVALGQWPRLQAERIAAQAGLGWAVLGFVVFGLNGRGLLEAAGSAVLGALPIYVLVLAVCGGVNWWRARSIAGQYRIFIVETDVDPWYSFSVYFAYRQNADKYLHEQRESFERVRLSWIDVGEEELGRYRNRRWRGPGVNPDLWGWTTYPFGETDPQAA